MVANATHSANSSHFSSSLTTKNSNPIAGNGGCLKHGGATTTGPDATHPPTIFQNLGGGGGEGQLGGRGVPPGGWGGVWPGVRGGGVWQGVGGGSSRGSWGHPARGEGGGVRVRARVTELVEPVLVL